MIRLIQNAIFRLWCQHEYNVIGTHQKLVNEGASVALETWVRLTCADCGKRIERPEVLHRHEELQQHYFKESKEE